MDHVDPESELASAFAMEEWLLIAWTEGGCRSFPDFYGRCVEILDGVEPAPGFRDLMRATWEARIEPLTHL